MRKHQQQQMLALLKTLGEAQSAGLYAACQEGARAVGEFIERLEGKDTRTAALLEEYCELLLKAGNGEVSAKRLRRHLIQVENSVKSELKPDRIEVVFFPYQLSMFDSFQSVYLAAKNDPNCNAYCVPIPWFERKPDGSLDEMHYDGDRYPANIEITDWREYDTAARHPDVIFIHNPYDGSNFVTSVHPSYYSRELKHKTDFLAYIDYGLPYWMPKTPVDGDWLPAYAMCDLLTAYSKEYAEQTQFVLRRAVSAGVLPKQAIAHDSAVALGSPKFDAVMNTKRADCLLPDQWQKRIEGKKVMLFSTSVGAILQGNESFIARLRSVLETFSSRHDIVLWWRPHPLSETTYASMRPRLLEEYSGIAKAYAAEGWGIYDDTPDLHRAIAWSDACYTDESSLMFLYLATGKPFSVRTFVHTPENLVADGSRDFTPILERRVKNMQSARGANIFDGNCTIWWHNFVDADFAGNVRYDNFLERFIHFVLNEDEYPEAQLYRSLKLQMLHDFVENADGTAGQKIYDFVKQRVLEVSSI